MDDVNKEITMQSHLSDALIEMDFDADRARLRIHLVKRIINDDRERIPVEELNQWVKEIIERHNLTGL